MFDDVPLLLVQDSEALAAAVEVIRRERAVAIDTEADSLHHYQEKVCLIQISVPGHDFVVDPLAVRDIGPLTAVLTDPGVVKVLHGADYDVVGLKRDFGVAMGPVFDTMVAAQFLGMHGVGLADVLAQVFQVEIDKRLQRHDWAERPLLPEHLDYARGDTHWLLPLREVLARRLQRVGLLEAVEEECRRIETREWHPRADGASAWLRVKGATGLDAAGQRILRRLHAYREEQARRMDRPVFKVIPDRVLLGVARIRPRDLQGLAPVVRLSSTLVRHHGHALLQAVAAGIDDPDPPPIDEKPAPTVARSRTAPAAPLVAERLKAWRKERQEAGGITPALLPSNAVIREIARAAPGTVEALAAVPDVRHWQVEAWGEEVVALVASCVETTDRSRTSRKRRRRHGRSGGGGGSSSPG